MPNPAFRPLFHLRCDFAHEIGFVDAMRTPEPPEKFERFMANLGAKKPEFLTNYDYSYYVKMCAMYHPCAYMGYLVVQPPADELVSMAVTDGHRILLADYEGLFRDMLGRLAHALGITDVMALPIFPKRAETPMQVGYPEHFVLHNTVTGEAGLYPWALRKNYLAVGVQVKLVPRPPGK